MKTINVQWLLTGNPLTIQQAHNSNLASIRMRAALTMTLLKNNFKSTVSPNLNISKNTNVIGVGKISVINDSNEYKTWLKVIQTAKRNGTKIFLDYTDNHLRDANSSTELFYAYKKIIPECDSVVCSSDYLQKSVQKHFDINTVIIDDPIEVEITPAKKILQHSPTGLWFGHVSNLNFLFSFLQNEFKPTFKIKLLVLSNVWQFSKEIIAHLEKSASPLVEIIVIPWSLENLHKVASISDFCIIPCGINDERKMGVSSNRLATSLALGLPCFADNAPSYNEFSKYFDPLKIELIEDFYSNNEYYIEKVSSSQFIINERFSKKTISEEWYRFLNDLC